MKKPKIDERGHLLGKCCRCRRESITYLCSVCYDKDCRGEDFTSNEWTVAHRSPWTSHRHNGRPIYMEHPPENTKFV